MSYQHAGGSQTPETNYDYAMDNVTREKRSEIMSRIRCRRTKPEMALHGLLKGNRVRHEMWPALPGNPDCLVGSTCVFVHGCFWHGCKRHFRLPKSNRKFWRDKIRRNGERHLRSSRRLRRSGYGVVTIWEHDLRSSRRSRAAAARPSATGGRGMTSFSRRILTRTRATRSR